jgi:hypothetical protein
MSNPTVITGLILLFLWVIGLWMAVEWWSPRFTLKEPTHPQPAEDSGSILPKLFWTCCGLIVASMCLKLSPWDEFLRPLWISTFVLGLVGLIALIVRVEITGMAEPRMIRLSTQHNLKTMDGYENILYWTFAYWVFEKPLPTVLTALMFGFGLPVVLFISDRGFDFAFCGALLMFGLWGICRFTTLVVKREGVTIHRWLERFPTTRIASADIAGVRVDESAIHRFFGVSRLTIKYAGDSEIKIALRDPTKAKDCIAGIVQSD